MTLSKEMDGKRDYRPSPLDLKNITVPKGLENLIEALAKNVHETWAEGRLKEGWTFGPKRDETLRQTPCLVPYEDLPEEEKEYDRKTALSTIGFILASGYTLVKNNDHD